MFHVGQHGELTECTVTDDSAWREIERLPEHVPPTAWSAARTLGWTLLRHFVPALATSLGPLALLGLVERLLTLYARLAKRWDEYVREDPTIHGALRE
jgi:hypothetical protein